MLGSGPVGDRRNSYAFLSLRGMDTAISLPRSEVGDEEPWGGLFADAAHASVGRYVLFFVVAVQQALLVDRIIHDCAAH